MFTASPIWVKFPERPEIRDDVWWHVYGAVIFRKAEPPSVDIVFEARPVVKLTPKGAWLDCLDGGKPRFVLGVEYGVGKRHAYKDPEHALESFRARLKRREMHWYNEGERIRVLKEHLNQEKTDAQNNAKNPHEASRLQGAHDQVLRRARLE